MTLKIIHQQSSNIAALSITIMLLLLRVIETSAQEIIKYGETTETALSELVFDSHKNPCSSIDIYSADIDYLSFESSDIVSKEIDNTRCRLFVSVQGRAIQINIKRNGYKTYTLIINTPKQKKCYTVEIACVGDSHRTPFTITSCYIYNADNNYNTLPFDAANSMYLTPVIKYNCATPGIYDIYVKVYDSSNKLSSNNKSPEGYSYVIKNKNFHTGYRSMDFTGWGSSKKGNWRAGNYRFEFYYNGKIIYTYRFELPQNN